MESDFQMVESPLETSPFSPQSNCAAQGLASLNGSTLCGCMVLGVGATGRGRGKQARLLWRLIWVSTQGNEIHMCPISMQLDTKPAV